MSGISLAELQAKALALLTDGARSSKRSTSRPMRLSTEVSGD